MKRIYQGIKNDKFALTCNGGLVRDAYGIAVTFSSPREAAQEAARRMQLASLGFLDAGQYSYESLAERQEARPVNLAVSGTGLKSNRRITLADLG
jgi:hypothetical protein